MGSGGSGPWGTYIGQDTVGAVVSGTDQLDLTAFGFANFAAIQAVTSDVGGSAVINVGGGNTVTLTGVLKGQLQPGDILVSGLSNAVFEPSDHAHQTGYPVGHAQGLPSVWEVDSSVSFTRRFLIRHMCR